jgi:hypothetical protein
MSTTDKRVEELLERWLASVDLHARYLPLDDAAYARVESWPKHQRPNAMVVNIARMRLLELKQHLSERRDAGDDRFAEALELMSFLTSLLGSEHIERFIPLATGKPPDTSISATVEQPRIIRPAGTARAATKKPARKEVSVTASSRTVDAPRSGAGPRTGETPAPARDTVSRQLVAARPRHAAAALAAAARPATPQSPPPRSASVTASAPIPAAQPRAVADIDSAMARQVISDAIRMLQWGREWPAVAGLIARMADRPPEADVWKILRTHRAEILSKARRTAT